MTVNGKHYLSKLEYLVLPILSGTIMKKCVSWRTKHHQILCLLFIYDLAAFFLVSGWAFWTNRWSPGDFFPWE